MLRFEHEMVDGIDKEAVLSDTQLTQQTAGDNIGIVSSEVEYANPNVGQQRSKVCFEVICEQGSAQHPSFYRFIAVARGRKAREAKRLLTKNSFIFLRGEYCNQELHIKYFRPIDFLQSRR